MLMSGTSVVCSAVSAPQVTVEAALFASGSFLALAQLSIFYPLLPSNAPGLNIYIIRKRHPEPPRSHCQRKGRRDATGEGGGGFTRKPPAIPRRDMPKAPNRGELPSGLRLLRLSKIL